MPLEGSGLSGLQVPPLQRVFSRLSWRERLFSLLPFLQGRLFSLERPFWQRLSWPVLLSWQARLF